MVHPIGVRILCKNAIVREGLGRILANNDFHVSQCSTIDEILNCASHAQVVDGVQINLIDAIFLEQDADTLKVLCASDVKAYNVILADKFDFDIMMDGFQDEAMAYIVKEISSDRLVGTLRLVAAGEPVLPPQLIDVLQSSSLSCDMQNVDEPVDAAGLSDREFQILRWLIVGHPNKVISQRMDISEATVKVHVKSVLRKLNVQNRTQAAIWGAKHGIRQNDGMSPRRVSGRSGDASQFPMFRLPGR